MWLRSLIVTLQVVLGLWRSAEGAADANERLIGWGGETYVPAGGGERYPSLHSADEGWRKGWIQTIAWKPRAVVYHNFLSDQECKHIIQLAGPTMKRSSVVSADKNNGSHFIDDIRTSFGTFIKRNHDPVVAAIEKRLSLWSHLPVIHQEHMQVLRYGITNKYGAHTDGLNRTATVLMYLVAPDAGGETAFVHSAWSHPQLRAEAEAEEWSDCARGHVAYKPKRGDALFFFDRLPDGQTADKHSEHTGCPVLGGVKWNAVKWIRAVPYRPEEWEESLKKAPAPEPDPGLCLDYDKGCQKWADGGECTRNVHYMVGGDYHKGHCRRACRTCEPCEEGDMVCFRRNRANAGYLNYDPAELQGL
ncbi:hypothetical protein HYH03_006254 [Edaphochlamys debaryana]|uniref:Fe2OG dioxygenase domain-containing protein n=1 Tax=Edaphochlamys debaryana TaxID=47281 RepID=A0A836C1L6_9CHLO|nr:hypothetical protein HYH03_006254 [Edaphochlamys debaryana]|eukprot:KAG2495654.1 hypothetical protein HYH03_006254 [Edaphochlamys debaryana]